MRINSRKFILRLSVFLVVTSSWAVRAQIKPELTSADFAKLSAAEIERRLPNEHPANYYVYAGRLWGEGERDKAVFWLYAGQLRFRFHLLANPNLEKSGDPALFGALQATVGEPINLYVGGDPKKWMMQIDDVLKWDDKTDNGFTSKEAHAKELAEIRAGLVKLKGYIASNEDKLRAQREAEGIGVIGVVDGVYVEERKPKMPKDWPTVRPRTTLAMLAGSYDRGYPAFLGNIFSINADIIGAGSFQLSVADPTHLTVAAKLDQKELGRRTIEVIETDGAVVFDETRPTKTDPSEGDTQVRFSLRLNEAEELIIQRELKTERKATNDARAFRRESIFWNRAKRIVSEVSP